MTEQDGTLLFRIDADTAPVERAADRAGGALLGIGEKASQGGNLITQALKGAGALVASTFAVSGARDFISNMISVRTHIQRNEAALTSFLGSKEKADQMMESFKKMAATTPIDLETLTSSTQMMLGFGVSADTAGKMMRVLGDISGGNTQRFQGLSLAFSQMTAAGRLMGQDLLQMINAGFNPLAEISRKTGKSVSELREEMSKGAISSQQVTEAFISATEEGGRFHGMLKAQSQGLAGSFAKLKGAMNGMYNELGKESEGAIKGAVDLAASLARNYQDVALALASVAAGYGVVKGAQMAYAASSDVAYAMKYKSEAEALNQLMTVEQRARISKLSMKDGAKAYGDALKAEVETTRAAVATKKAAALEEAAASKAKFTAAQMEVANARKLVAAKQAELVAAQGTANARKIEVAQTQLSNAQERLHVALRERSTAVGVRQAAQERVVAAVRAEGAVATTADTAASGANLTVTNLLTAAKNAAAQAAARLNAVIMANAWMLAVAAIAAMVYGLYKLITYQSDAEKRQKALNKAYEEGTKSAAGEIAKLDALYDELKKAKKGSDEYKKAKDAIVKQYGGYLDKLSAERGKVIDVANAYDLLKKKVEAAAKARAMKTYIDKQLEDSGDKRGELIDELRERLSGTYHGANLDKQLDKMLGMIGRNDKGLNNWLKIWDKEVIESVTMVGKQTYRYNNVANVIEKIRQLNAQDKKTLKDAERRFDMSWSDALANADEGQAPPTNGGGNNGGKNNGGGNNGGRGHSGGGSTENPEIERQKQLYALQRQMEQQEAAQAKRHRDEALKREQDEVERWQDGTEKQLKLIELGKRAKLNALQDEQDALLEKLRDTAEKKWEINNPKAVKAGQHFDRKSVTEKDLAKSDKFAILTQAAHIAQEAQKDEQKVYAQIIKDTRSLEEKKLEVKREYAQKRKIIEERLLTGEAHVSNLEVLKQQEAAALKQITDQQLQHAQNTLPIFTKLFADAAQKSRHEIKGLIKTTEDFLKALADPNGKKRALEFGMSESTFEMLQMSPEKIQAIRQQLDKLYQYDNSSKDPFSKLLETIEKVKKEGNNLDLSEKMQKIAGAAVPAIGAVKGLTSQFAEAARAAGADGLAEEADALGATLEGLGNIAQGFAQGGVVGAALAAVGEGMKVVTKAFEAAARHKQALLEIQKEINDQQELYNDLLRKEQMEARNMDSIFGSSKRGRALENLKAATGLDKEIKKQIKGNFEELVKYRKKLAEDLKIDQNNYHFDTFDFFMKRFILTPSGLTHAGEKDVAGLAKLSVKTGHVKTGLFGWGAGRDTFSALTSQYKDLVKANGHLNLELAKSIVQTRQFEGDGKKTFEALIKKEEQYEEALKKMEEYLGGIFGNYGDEVINAVVDAFNKGEDAAKAFGDTTSKVMQQMVKDMMQASILQPILKEQAEKVKRAFESGDNNTMLKAAAQATKVIQGAQGRLKEKYAQLIGELKKEGIDLSAEGDKREGMKRGIATASQESVDENNGRLTAIQGHTFLIQQQTEQITKHSAAILQTVMRISEDTNQISERLGHIETDTRAVRNTFEDIALRGIKLNT
jgi:hypothetical protein|nr:MAG TPA: tail tape measure protein [Caudoviricetes sp.]